MLQEVRDALVAAEPANADVIPVEEVAGDVVRIPAYYDGTGTWQGGTIWRNGEGFRARLDDGRFANFPTAGEAVTWFLATADVWQD